MAEYSKASIVSVTDTNNKHATTNSIGVTAYHYWAVTVSDAATTATVTIQPYQQFVVTTSGSGGQWNANITRSTGGSSGSSCQWRAYNSTTSTNLGSIMNYSYKGGSSSSGTGVDVAMGSASTFTITKTTSTQDITIHKLGTFSGSSGFLYLQLQARASGNTSYKISRSSPVEGPAPFTYTIGTIYKYTISYNMNGGTGTIASQQKWHGTNITLSSTRPTRDGYDFQGWSLTQNGSVAYAPGASFGLNQNQTLWAVWKKKTYAVTYYTRTGSPSIAAQTKTHGETLTLSGTVPSKTNYTFKGWATSEANAKANTGTIYQKSGQYTGNTALNLYAIWELNHTAPVISSLTAVRCLDNGNVNDEGKCAKVSFHWKVFTGSPQYYEGTGTGYQTNKAKTCTITVGSGAVIDTLTIDATDSQMSGTENNVTKILGTSSIYESDSTYPVTITFSDNPPIGSSLSTTARNTLPTAFLPMDFNADASALGFFMPAPNSGNGAYFGKDVHIYVNSATTEGIDGQITQALTNLGWTSVLQ